MPTMADSDQPENEQTTPAKTGALETERKNHDPNQHDQIQQKGCTRAEVRKEAKLQFKLAGPLVAISLLQYCLQVISVMFVGHLGELPLAGASLATSFAAVSGFSVLLGMSSALETLCGQAYGAKQYHMLGIHTQRAMIVLLILCLPLALIWLYAGNILILLGQNHEIATEAGKFTRVMIPGLFAYALLQCLTRFLQTQKVVISMLITSGLTALLHVLVCWSFVYKFGFGMEGAAWANVFSNWVNVILLGVYVKCSPAFAETWTGFSRKAFNDIITFLKLAIPSAFMICLEYWSFELVVILSGLLPNPKLQTSVLSMSLNTCWMVYQISVGLGAAISTRVANELGAGSAKGARLALRVMVIIALVEGAIVFSITILVRHVWGKLYSNEKEVIAYVARMMPLLALSDFLDGFQCVLSGPARGCGWQKLCAFINLFAYYIVAIPSAVILAFVVKIGGKGFWIGIIPGLTVQIIALIVVNVLTNWDREAQKAINRVEKTSTTVREEDLQLKHPDQASGTSQSIQEDEGSNIEKQREKQKENTGKSSEKTVFTYQRRKEHEGPTQIVERTRKLEEEDIYREREVRWIK